MNARALRLPPAARIREYRKIPKISPGAYTFQRPFLRGLFLEGPIFGGAYVRREICVSKSIGLACSRKEIYHFTLFYFVFKGKFQVQALRGAYIRRGDLTEGFLRYDFGGLIFGGAYTWRGLFSEFYGIMTGFFENLVNSKFWACFQSSMLLWLLW